MGVCVEFEALIRKLVGESSYFVDIQAMKSSDNKVVRGLASKLALRPRHKLVNVFLRIAMSGEYMKYKDKISMKLS